MEVDKRWNGMRQCGSGRPPLLTDKQQMAIQEIVFKHRDDSVVTIACIKKLFQSRRRFCYRTLHEAGLAWLRRRVKRHVAPQYRQPRLTMTGERGRKLRGECLAGSPAPVA